MTLVSQQSAALALGLEIFNPTLTITLYPKNPQPQIGNNKTAQQQQNSGVIYFHKIKMTPLPAEIWMMIVEAAKDEYWTDHQLKVALEWNMY